jgi:putative ABC transport system ATP-binding protein
MNNNKDNTAVLCRNLTKTFGTGEAKVEALRGISLTVKAGELRLLMGPSGSGKTTLISIIAGILTQDGGECLVKGVDINHLSDEERTHFRGENIGFVFQAFRLVPMITVEENICVPLLLNGIQRKDALDQSKAILAEFGMADKIGSYPPDLSGGQQQRVAIARAIVHRPQFIVCDEPTSFLDHDTGMKVMELLRELVEKNKITLIVVTHDPRIVQFADKIDRIEDGKIVGQ